MDLMVTPQSADSDRILARFEELADEMDRDATSLLEGGGAGSLSYSNCTRMDAQSIRKVVAELRTGRPGVPD